MINVVHSSNYRIGIDPDDYRSHVIDREPGYDYVLRIKCYSTRKNESYNVTVTFNSSELDEAKETIKSYLDAREEWSKKNLMAGGIHSC